MPTIHLSIPEWMYEELKRKAEDMGIQVTDLVKFYIKNGMEGKNEESPRNENTEKLEESVTYLEARVAQLDLLVMELVRKLKVLEESEDDEQVEIDQ
ncbi:hypothetical protein [Metallosphaera hakonensis]|uniref:CopG family transcriptional regulator n=1 Tax=Metallosphaera hakonensis JCM 8857 = DSM 7519 TaxID=1293036 RepID=A0A2U9IRY4_9CREN|nr:hypothetical protein [Metallosphaera hakonensis]AWR98799.1 hypothetical protein DFR87_02830 [Metallosphaera hakonensis JCM 8857 = DSM 7519]